jgi:UV DNA damage endonuclease
VCITASNQVRYKTLTRKRLLQLEPTVQRQTLRELYAENLRRFELAIDFCQAEHIRLYRLTSALFPFADDPLGEEVLIEFAEPLKQLGDRIQQLNIRVVLHPDQFVVLNSDRPDVIANSIKILTTHARIFDLLGFPQSQWAAMNIHGGKGDRAERLINVIRDLPATIHARLTLENDEYTYSSAEILAVCQAAQVAMVFDAHHHVIHEHLESYEHPSIAQMLAAARTTWTNPDWQLVHISNGSEFFTDPRHSDLITEMPSAYWDVPWIEIEAKLKEQAIADLRQTWQPNRLTQPTIPRLVAKA